MKGSFERVSPAAFAERIGIPLGWFVISHRWMPEKKQRRERHGKWFKLSTSSVSLTGYSASQPIFVVRLATQAT